MIKENNILKEIDFLEKNIKEVKRKLLTIKQEGQNKEIKSNYFRNPVLMKTSEAIF